MQNSTLPGNSTHEQRRRGPQSGKRLVGASDPAECRFWRGFYCETAQVFRFMKTKEPHAVRLGDHVSVYAGCSFALGVNGSAVVGDFTLLNGALVMADERIEIGSHCLISWNVGIADSDFHPLEPAQRLIDAQAVCAILQRSPTPS